MEVGEERQSEAGNRDSREGVCYANYAAELKCGIQICSLKQEEFPPLKVLSALG